MSDAKLQARFDRQIDHLRRVFEQERQMLAYDIHDGALQDLVSAKWAIESNLAKLQSSLTCNVDLLESARDLVDHAIAELRNVVVENRQFTLGELDLSEAIHEFISRLPDRSPPITCDDPAQGNQPGPSKGELAGRSPGLESRVGPEEADDSSNSEAQCSREPRSSPDSQTHSPLRRVPIDLKIDIHSDQLRGDLQLNLYRIVQQAVHNSLSHAQPGKIHVTLVQTSTAIRVTVADNGIGFDQTSTPRGGLGLETIRQRAAMFDGTCRIESRHGVGTTIDVTIPLSTESEPP